MHFGKTTLALALAGSALASSAFTLGRVQGTAWVGRPLDVTIFVQADPGSTTASLCPEVEVFYADNRVEGSRVQVLAEPTATADSYALRITSSLTIDEPFVTLNVRAGCDTKLSRRYVVLADFPNEPSATSTRTSIEPAVPTLSAADATATTASPPNPASAASVAPPAQRIEAAVSSPSVTPPLLRKSAKPATAPRTTATTAAPKPPAASAGAGRSRLKLDPIETLADRVKTLEATTSSVPLEELVRESQRVQQLQSDVKVLLQQAAKNEANMALLRERLERAEADRAPALLIYGLMGLVLLCMGGVAMLWVRRPKAPDWRLETTDVVEKHTAAPPVSPQDTINSELVPAERASRPAEVVDSGMDVNLMDVDAEQFVSLIHPAATQTMELTEQTAEQRVPADMLAQHPDFHEDAMVDVHQQAEFFEKLGKFNEAIEALEKRIRTHAKNSPWLYLELLRIAHLHSLKTDFRQFREEFQQVFNCMVPEFALFKDEGRSLEAYPALLRQLTQLWPQASVLDVLEAQVLRDPWDPQPDRFEMAAFKDLLTLHGLARARMETTSSAEAYDSQHVDLDL